MIDIDSAPTMPGFDFAVGLAAPVAANAVKHVRDGGQLASAVQVPEDANAGSRIRIHNIMTSEDPAMLQRIADAAERGDLVIPIAKRLGLGEVAEATRRCWWPTRKDYPDIELTSPAFQDGAC